MILGYGQDLDPVASQSPTQGTPCAYIPSEGIRLNLLDECVEVSIGKGVAISKIHFVLGVGELILPRESVELLILGSAFTIAVLEVLDVLPAPVPAQVLLL